MKMKKFISKARSRLAAAIGSMFLFTTVATPLVEANFWEQRRQASRRVSSEGTPMVASRPSGTAFDQVLPAVSNGFAGFPTVPPAELKGMSSSADMRSSRLPSWLRGLPTSAGEIRNVVLAKNPETAPVAVLVQDVHAVFSAQKSISQIVSHVESSTARDNRGDVLIGLEGAYRSFDIDRFRAFRDRPGHELVSELLLKTNLIAGPEFYAFQAEKKPFLWGIETPADYVENVEAYRASHSSIVRVKAVIGSAQAAVEKKGETVFSTGLKNLNRVLAGYDRGDVSITDMVETLRVQVPSMNVPEVEKLSRALAIEKQLDFGQVERERTALVEVLVRALDSASVQSLVSASLGYRSGQISFGAYHHQLKTLVKTHGIRWEGYSSFDQYVKYVLMAESIDKFKLFDELEDMKSKAVVASARSAQERDVMGLAEDLRLAARLVRHEFGPAEWNLYQSRRSDLENLSTRLSGLIEGVVGPSKEDLALFERFYVAADRRNISLTDNLLEKAHEINSKVMVLVAGGFHTPALESRLKEKGLSVVTITPHIGEIPKNHNYLDIFVAKNIPIEQYLAGDKLYLSPPRVNSESMGVSVADIREGTIGAAGAAAYVAAGAATAKEVEAGLGVQVNQAQNAGQSEVTAVAKDGTKATVVGKKEADGSTSLTLSVGRANKSSGKNLFSRTGEFVASAVKAVTDFFDNRNISSFTKVAVGASLAVVTVVSLASLGLVDFSTDHLVEAVSFAGGLGTLHSNEEGKKSGKWVGHWNSFYKKGIYFPRFIDDVVYVFTAIIGILVPHYVRLVQVPAKEVINVRQFNISNGQWLSETGSGVFTEHNVGRFAQSVSNAIYDETGKPHGSGIEILVGFDARKGSKKSALHLARVLQANGHKVKIADQIWATHAGSDLTVKGKPFSYSLWVSAGSAPRYAKDDGETESMGIMLFKDGAPVSDNFSRQVTEKSSETGSYFYSRKIIDEYPVKEDSIELHKKVFIPDVSGWVPEDLKGKVVVNVMHGSSAQEAELLEDLKIAGAIINKSPMGGEQDLGTVPHNGYSVLWAPNPLDSTFTKTTLEKLTPGQWAFFFDGDGQQLVVAERPAQNGPVHVFSPGELALLMADFLIERNEVTEIIRTMPSTRWLDRLASHMRIPIRVNRMGGDAYSDSRKEGFKKLVTDAGGHIIFPYNGHVLINSALAQSLLVFEIIKEKGSLGNYLREIKSKVGGKNLIAQRQDFAVDEKQMEQILAIREKQHTQDSFTGQVRDALRLRGIHKTIKSINVQDQQGLLVEFQDGTWFMWRRTSPDGLGIRLYVEMESERVASSVISTVDWVLKGFQEFNLLQYSIQQISADKAVALTHTILPEYWNEADDVFNHVNSFLTIAESLGRNLLARQNLDASQEFVPLEILKGVSQVMALPQMSYACPPDMAERQRDLRNRLETLATAVGSLLERQRTDEIESVLLSGGITKFQGGQHIIHNAAGEAEIETLPPDAWSPYSRAGEVWAPYLHRDSLASMILNSKLSLDSTTDNVIADGMNPLVKKISDHIRSKFPGAGPKLLVFASEEASVMKEPGPVLDIAKAVGFSIGTDMNQYEIFSEKLLQAFAYLKQQELWTEKKEEARTNPEVQKVLDQVMELEQVRAAGLERNIVLMRLISMNHSWDVYSSALKKLPEPGTKFNSEHQKHVELVLLAGGMASRWGASLIGFLEKHLLTILPDGPRQVAVRWLNEHNGISLAMNSMAHNGGGRLSVVVSPFTWFEVIAELYKRRVEEGPRGVQVDVNVILQNPGQAMTLENGAFKIGSDGKIVREPAPKVLGHGNVRGAPAAFLDALSNGVVYGLWRSGDGPLGQLAHPSIQDVINRMVSDAEGGEPLDHVAIVNRREPGQAGGGAVAVEGKNGVPVPTLMDTLIPKVANKDGFNPDRDITLFSTFQNMINYAAAIYAVSEGVLIDGQPLMSFEDYVRVSKLDPQALSGLKNRIAGLSNEQALLITNRFMKLLPSEYVKKETKVTKGTIETIESFVQWEQISGMWHGIIPSKVKERMAKEGHRSDKPGSLLYLDVALREGELLGTDGSLSSFAEVKSAPGLYGILPWVKKLIALLTERGVFSPEILGGDSAEKRRSTDRMQGGYINFGVLFEFFGVRWVRNVLAGVMLAVFSTSAMAAPGMVTATLATLAAAPFAVFMLGGVAVAGGAYYLYQKLTKPSAEEGRTLNAVLNVQPLNADDLVPRAGKQLQDLEISKRALIGAVGLTNVIGESSIPDAGNNLVDRSVRVAILSGAASRENLAMEALSVMDRLKKFAQELVLGNKRNFVASVDKISEVVARSSSKLVEVDKLEPGSVKAIHLDETSDSEMIKNTVSFLEKLQTNEGRTSIASPGSGVVITLAPGMEQGSNEADVKKIIQLGNSLSGLPVAVQMLAENDGIMSTAESGLTLRLTNIVGLLNMQIGDITKIQTVTSPTSTAQFDQEGIPESVLVEKILWLLNGIGLVISSEGTENEIRSLVAALKAA